MGVGWAGGHTSLGSGQGLCILLYVHTSMYIGSVYISLATSKTPSMGRSVLILDAQLPQTCSREFYAEGRVGCGSMAVGDGSGLGEMWGLQQRLLPPPPMPSPAAGIMFPFHGELP